MEYPLNVYTNVLRENAVKENELISDLAKNYNWDVLIEMLEGNSSMINSTRYSVENGPPPKMYTPLQQAAHGTAPKEVFAKLISLKASKTLKTSDGETAYDIGKRKGLHQEILDLISIPKEIRQNEESIKKMEAGLHQAIRERVEDLITKNGQQLPQLSFLYEFGNFWYPVPGMYGGFNVEKTDNGVTTESWCRVAGGSGQRHEVDKEGNVKMTAEGFV